MPGGSRRNQTAVPEPQTVVVTLPGQVDVSNKGLVQAALVRALATGPKVVVADGTGTGSCDNAAVAALIGADHQAATAGAQLRVVMPNASVRRELELSGAGLVLRVYPSLATAYGCDGSAPPPTAA
jgi:anti-anti-sigma factor